MNRPNLASASFRFSAVFFLVLPLTITDVSASDLSRSCPGFQREVEAFELSQSRVNNRCIQEDPSRPTRHRPPSLRRRRRKRGRSPATPRCACATVLGGEMT
uniref:Putative secreted protein n=1 Tax=Ixodes ricinus TaxID=34613 RepID=A0A6B0U9M0_IXORI